MKQLLILVATITLLATAAACNRSDYQPQNGDIIFQTSRSSQSQAIQLAIHSRWSHMGIIFIRDNKAYVFEAVQPVKLTPLKQWIARGQDGHFAIKRLRNAKQLLNAKILQNMQAEGEEFIGRDYDPYFEWSDKRIYCSELVWKVYARGAGIRLSDPSRMRDFDLTNRKVAAKLHERYGSHVPLDEAVVSPQEIYSSDKLLTVYQQ